MIRNKLIFFLIFFICGILFFFLYNKWLVISWTLPNIKTNIELTKIDKKKFKIWYWSDNSLKFDTKEIVWTKNNALNAEHLVCNWLEQLYQEEIIKKAISLQSLSLGENNKEIIISLDQPLLNLDSSTYDKLMLVESLLQTIRQTDLDCQTVRLLVGHEEYNDQYLNFSNSWPISGFVNNLVGQNNICDHATCLFTKKDQPLTIMLAPSGDAACVGRVINDNFERGLTLQYAQSLKESLESCLHNSRVILTRVPGEKLEMLQGASFANRLNADLFISINFYQQDSLQAPSNQTSNQKGYIYYFISNPATDFLAKNSDSLYFAQYNQAHLSNISRSYHIACCLHQFFSSRPADKFYMEKPIGLPFKPLVAVQVPSIALEMGINNQEAIKQWIAPISQAICHIVQQK